MIWQHLHKVAGVEMAFHIVSWNLDETQACEAAGNIGFGTVDRYTALHRDSPDVPPFDPFPGGDPPARWRRVVDGEVAR